MSSPFPFWSLYRSISVRWFLMQDPKAWCYTVDANKRWEHCSPLCSAKPPPVPTQRPQPIPDLSNVAGTRVRDVPEQVPQIEPRSKYNQRGSCLKNCKSRSLSSGISQCGSNGGQCRAPKPHRPSILSWFIPETNQDCQSGQCLDIIGESSQNRYWTNNVTHAVQ